MTLEHLKVTVYVDKATAIVAGHSMYGETERILTEDVLAQLTPEERAWVAARAGRFPLNKVVNTFGHDAANTVLIAAPPKNPDEWAALIRTVKAQTDALEAARLAAEVAQLTKDAAEAEATFQAAAAVPYDALQAAVRAEVRFDELSSWGFMHALRRAGVDVACGCEALTRHAGLAALYAQHKGAQADYCDAELMAARQREEQAKVVRALHEVVERAVVDAIVQRAAVAAPAQLLAERHAQGCLPAAELDALVRAWAFDVYDVAFAPFRRLTAKDIKHGFVDEGRTVACDGANEPDAIEYDTEPAAGHERGLSAGGFTALHEALRLAAAAHGADQPCTWAVKARLHLATCQWCEREAVRETLYVTCTLPTGRVLSREYAAEARP